MAITVVLASLAALLSILALVFPWVIFSKSSPQTDIQLYISGFQMLGWAGSLAVVCLSVLACVVVWYKGAVWCVLALPGSLVLFVLAMDVQDQIATLQEYLRVEKSTGGIVVKIDEVARRQHPDLADLPIRTVNAGLGINLSKAVIVVAASTFAVYLATSMRSLLHK